MQNKIKISESIMELTKALGKFQEQSKKIAPNAKNPFYNSKYLTLAGLWEAIEKPLKDNGLSIIQVAHGTCAITTILRHLISEEFIQSTLMLAPEETNPQKLGGAITYARRYSLVALLGIIDDDDDGNFASGLTYKKTPDKGTKQDIPSANHTKKQSKMITLPATFERQSDAAMFIKCNQFEGWLPKSQITFNENTNEVTIPEWLVEKNKIL